MICLGLALYECPGTKLFCMRMIWTFILIAVAAVAQPGVQRKDFQVPGENGIQLHLREVVAAKAKDSSPILLVHGARVPGVGSFDLPVPNGSLAADSAEAGF